MRLRQAKKSHLNEPRGSCRYREAAKRLKRHFRRHSRKEARRFVRFTQYFTNATVSFDGLSVAAAEVILETMKLVRHQPTEG